MPPSDDVGVIEAVRICMVGYGRMARAHSRCLSTIPDVVLDTVVGRDPQGTEALAREFGYIHASCDLELAMQRADLDTVIVCTPNDQHAEQTEMALRAGKHLLCEIPLAMSLREAKELAGIAEREDLRLMVCHTERFEAGRMELTRRISSGELHPLHVIGRFHMFRRGNVQTAPERRGWIDNLLWHHGCHTVDAILTMLDETETLDLAAQLGPAWPGLDVPIDVDLQWRTPKGVLVSVTLSHNARWGAHDYRLICLEDTIVCDRGTLSNKEGTLLDADDKLNPNLLQDREFVSAIREGREPAVSASSVLPTMRVLQAAWDIWQAS